MNQLEALTDALIRMTEYGDPGSKLYRYRNPLGLKVFCIHGRGLGRCEECPERAPRLGQIWHRRHWDKDNGLRIFETVANGYQAALFDVKQKCSGKSHANMREGTLADLCIAYSMPGTRAADPVAKFLRKALGRDDISSLSKVSEFLNGG